MLSFLLYFYLFTKEGEHTQPCCASLSCITAFFGENTQGSNNDGTVQKADNNSNCYYFSQSKATLAQNAAKYFEPAYLQSRNNQSIHKARYCPLNFVFYISS